MKKIIFITFAFVLLTVSCADKNAFTIEGYLTSNGFDGKRVVLQVLDSTWKWNMNNLINIDFVTIENGKFQFKGQAKEEPSVYFVSLENPPKYMDIPIPFIIEPGKIKIELDTIFSITGTPLNDAFKQINDKNINLLEKIKALDLQKEQNPNDTETQIAMEKMLEEDYQVILNEAYEFIKSNIHNQVGAFLFTISSDKYSLAQTEELMNGIKEEYRNVPAIQSLASRLNAMKVTAVNSVYIDLKGKTPDGKDISLSDYVGKNRCVLIDFWASWCGPCIQEMPNVKEVYEKYHDKGFEIVGISLDTSNDSWKNAIEKLGITWPQMSDLEGWKSGMVRTYGVGGIPHTLLINENGIITAKNLRGEELGRKVAEVLEE